MNKKILTIILIGVFFLIGIGLIVAEDKIKKDKNLSFTNDEIENLNYYGITNPQISECVPLDDYFCKAKLYEERGINKEFKVEYNYCEEYVLIPEEEICEVIDEEIGLECYTEPEHKSNECKKWKTLNDKEIENELEKQTKDFLKEVSEIKDKRDKEKLNETLSSELNFIFDNR